VRGFGTETKTACYLHTVRTQVTVLYLAVPSGSLVFQVLHSLTKIGCNHMMITVLQICTSGDTTVP